LLQTTVYSKSYTRALLDFLINEEKFHVQLSKTLSCIAVPGFPFNLYSDDSVRSPTEMFSLSQFVTTERAVKQRMRITFAPVAEQNP
jgi:hypothetical protein